jgi:hypothetical protein
MLAARNETHGECRSKLYKTWADMRRRCLDQKNKCWKDYGGRGISFAAEWGDFSTFRAWAIDHGFKPSLTLERADVNGNYCPENCSWVPMAAQARNRRDTVRLEAWGESKTALDWASDSRCVVSAHTLRKRARRGWDHESAISTPLQQEPSPPTAYISALGETKPVCDWATDLRCVVSHVALRMRLHRGWDPETAITQPARSKH